MKAGYNSEHVVETMMIDRKGRRTRIPLGRTAAVVLAGIISMCVSISAFCQETTKKSRIAILPPRSIGVSAEIVRRATSLIEVTLVRTKAYSVVSTTGRDQTLRAQETALAGCGDERCAIELGRLLSTEKIVFGIIAALENTLIINFKIIDITTSKIIGNESARIAGNEELQTACAQLAQALVEEALSGTEPVLTPDEQAIEELLAAAAVQEPPRGDMPDLLGFAVMTGGIFFIEAGNAFGVMGFESMLKSEVLYGEYMKAAGDFETLYTTYASVQGCSTILGVSSYSLLGLGAGGLSAGVFLFPSNAYRLSFWGRLAYSAGLACSVSGNTLALMAGNQEYENGLLYDAYMNATDDWAALYQQYQAGYTAYSLERIIGYSLWGLGGIAMAGSLFLPGEKAPMEDSLLNKIVFASGMALVSGGGFLQPMALNARQAAEEKYKAYMKATTGIDTLYADYSSSHGQYILLSAFSYGLLAGGAAAVITSLFIPFGTPMAQEGVETPFNVSMIPLPNGVALLIHITARRFQL